MLQAKCNTALDLSPYLIFLEQFVESVSDYSSKYSSQMSILYAPENLIGKPSKYPAYGDFTDTYMLRTYGKWWNESEGAQPHYMSKDIDHIVSEDYVTVSFEHAVIPKSISIYETYNPGAVVRIWGRTSSKWILLWESPPKHYMPTPNIFRPLLKPIQECITKIRIEFNQTLLSYHTSIDAILLAGYKSKSLLYSSLLSNGLLEQCVTPKPPSEEYQIVENTIKGIDNFSKLPYEAVLHIFQYLDLISLCRSAQVNKRFYSVSCDSILYRELSLKRYWHKINNGTLTHLLNKCNQIKKLDISWCGNDREISEETFVGLLQECCCQITHLSAGGCGFIKTISLNKIGGCSELTDLRLRNCSGHGSLFMPLANLSKLTALDLYSTQIEDDVLISILKSNLDLRHLILDFCECLRNLNEVAETVRNYNKKLVTWSSWKTTTLTSVGVEHLSYCSHLRELDVGWCLLLSSPGNCLERVAIGCKDLRRLIICGWRSVTDHSLLPIIRSCKQLTQLDLLGIRNISGAICERILASLPKLQLVDISFCDGINDHQVFMMREQYPEVDIQRSCSSNNAVIY